MRVHCEVSVLLLDFLRFTLKGGGACSRKEKEGGVKKSRFLESWVASEKKQLNSTWNSLITFVLLINFCIISLKPSRCYQHCWIYSDPRSSQRKRFCLHHFLAFAPWNQSVEHQNPGSFFQRLAFHLLCAICSTIFCRKFPWRLLYELIFPLPNLKEGGENAFYKFQNDSNLGCKKTRFSLS